MPCDGQLKTAAAQRRQPTGPDSPGTKAAVTPGLRYLLKAKGIQSGWWKKAVTDTSYDPRLQTPQTGDRDPVSM